MKVVLDGGVCFDPFGACFDYYSQLAPRLVALGCDVTLTPSPTGVLESLQGSGAKVTRTVLPTAPWMPHGPVRRWLSARKAQLERWRLQWHSTSPGSTLYQSFYYGLSPSPSWTSIGMVLDLIPEKFPHWFEVLDEDFLSRRAKYIRSASHYIAISQSTKQDLVSLFGIDPNKVHVVHLAVDAAEFQGPLDTLEATEWLHNLGVVRPFLLQVGGRKHHKNFLRVLEAFSEVAWQADIALVCAGEQWDAEELQRIKALGLQDRVHLVYRPLKSELVRLYRMAEGLVYPSLYEGFGLPPLEAMASGCPVAASQGGSIPEVVGDAAMPFDPYETGSIRRALEKILDPFEADALRAKGLERVKLFHWDRVADETYGVYRSVFEGLHAEREKVSSRGKRSINPSSKWSEDGTA